MRRRYGCRCRSSGSACDEPRARWRSRARALFGGQHAVERDDPLDAVDATDASAAIIILDIDLLMGQCDADALKQQSLAFGVCAASSTCSCRARTAGNRKAPGRATIAQRRRFVGEQRVAAVADRILVAPKAVLTDFDVDRMSCMATLS